MRLCLRNPLRRITLTVALAIMAALSATPAHAQLVPDKLPAEFTSDSTAWQRVLAYFVSSMSGTIVHAALDTAAQPWHIRVPADEPQASLLRAQLQTILRAREVSEADSVFYSVGLEPLTLVNDTAWVTVRTEMARRCPGTPRLAGHSNTERVYVARGRFGLWEVARSKDLVHGDIPSCPTPRQ